MTTYLHILVSFPLLFILFSGIGLFVTHRFTEDTRDEHPPFWIGYALSIALLQIWHLFFPVNRVAFAVLLILSLTGLVIQRHLLFRFLAYTMPYMKYTLILLLPIALWITHYALNNPPHYDDGLYHAQELQWAGEYAIVPGLGNLHGRLAFNNAAALLNTTVYTVTIFPHPRYLLNSLLLIVFIGQALWHGCKIVKDRHAELYRYVYLLFLPPALFFTDSTNMNSLKNDLPAALLSVIVAAELLRLIEHPPQRPYKAVFQLTLLICVAVAIKLSGAVLGALLLVVLFGCVLLRYRPMLPRLVPLGAAIIVAVIGVWMLRGVILSGYPLYPFTPVSIPVEWQMDRQTVQAEADGVRSWARTPDADPEIVLGNWDWLPGWWQRNTATHFVELVVPLLLITFSLLLMLGVLLRDRSLQPFKSRWWLFLVPVLPAILFWFFNAPDTRFGWHNLWLLAVGMLLICLQTVNRLHVGGLVTAFVLGVGVILNALLTEDLQRSDTAYPGAPYENFYSYHGVKLNVPMYSPQCWDSALPCTPYPNYYVALRDRFNVGSGYKLEAIESDKAAFSLVEIMQEGDIVAADYVSSLNSGILPRDGILIGRGWHPLETWEGGQHRWVENHAEIYVTECSGDHTQIELQVEPGPSLEGEPFELLLLDEQEQVVDRARVNGLQTVRFDLPLTQERVHVFRLYTEAKGEPAPNDGRMLNFRVTAIQWG